MLPCFSCQSNGEWMEVAWQIAWCARHYHQQHWHWIRFRRRTVISSPQLLASIKGLWSFCTLSYEGNSRNRKRRSYGGIRSTLRRASCWRDHNLKMVYSTSRNVSPDRLVFLRSVLLFRGTTNWNEKDYLYLLFLCHFNLNFVVFVCWCRERFHTSMSQSKTDFWERTDFITIIWSFFIDVDGLLISIRLLI